jgi:hypothetical protein
MTDVGRSEHWLDRLAARRTRRQLMKAGLVGAAATVLPVGPFRPAPAAAENFVIGVPPCFTGCKAFTHNTFKAAKTTCQEKYEYQGVPLVFDVLLGGLFRGAISESRSRAARQRCLDTAMLNQKAQQFDCSQANCSGFDPRQKGGPCETCSANCCTCPVTPEGYICCFFECEDSNHNCCGS